MTKVSTYEAIEAAIASDGDFVIVGVIDSPIITNLHTDIGYDASKTIFVASRKGEGVEQMRKRMREIIKLPEAPPDRLVLFLSIKEELNDLAYHMRMQSGYVHQTLVRLYAGASEAESAYAQYQALKINDAEYARTMSMAEEMSQKYS